MIVTEPENATAQNADGWFTPGRFAALLAALIAATFSGVLLGQETFYYRDFGLFGYPLAHYQRECFWRGELPLWNPLNLCGLPFLAQWNTLTLYPPALFYLIFPLSWSLGVFNLAHLWLAGMGMYFLAHRWLGNRLAASVAGVAFAFNGLTWHCLMWPNDIAALGWMPWVVLTVEGAWRQIQNSQAEHRTSSAAPPPFDVQRSMFDVRCFLKSSRPIILAVLAGAMQMLAGAPEIILLTWLLLAALWLTQFFWGRTSKKFMLGRIVAVVLLVAGLSAAQLLPFLELLSHSHRAGGGEKGAEWAMPLSGPANFLVPQFHCFAAAQGVFVQYGQYWTSSYYVGAGVLALALAGAGCVRKRRVWLLLAVTVGCVWMALGAQAHLYPLGRKLLPVLALMRYPIKFIVLPVFLIPLLAAYGVRWHQTQANAGNSLRARDILKNIALLLLVLIGVILLVAWKYPLVKDNWTVTWQGALGRAAFLVLIPGVLIWATRVAQFKTQVLLRLALLALLWADVYTHAPNLNPTVPRSVFEPGLMRKALNLTPQAQPGEPRFMETPAIMAKVHVLSIEQPKEDFLCRRQVLYDNCNLLDGVPKLDGLYSLYVKETMQALSVIYNADEQQKDAKGLKDFLGIAYISSPDADPGKALDWLARNTAMPLVTAGQQPVFAEDNDTTAGLTAANFEPRQTVYLPTAARSEVKAARSEAKILSAQIEAQRLRMEVEARAPAMLVVAQSFYRPWHAYVDGQRVKLWRANLGFQALEVPAGRHNVKVIYEDRVFVIGMVISCATVVALVMIWFSGRRTQ